mmetsp:Transcript_99419/g.259195  ORF Transcript_99419/g.259195 Transcript_99419/m.259195 type:complete len:532 (+) Transcript_99419:260-1855(+)
MPGQALLEDLRAEHRQAPVVVELAVVLLDVVAAALHLRAPLPQLVLLLLKAALDDLGAVCEPLAEILRALLGDELGLHGVQLGVACLLVDEVHKIGGEDVHLRRLLLRLVLLGAVLAVRPGPRRVLAGEVVHRGLQHLVVLLAGARQRHAAALGLLVGAGGAYLLLLLLPQDQLLVPALLRLRQAIAAGDLHLQELLDLLCGGRRRLRRVPLEAAVPAEVGLAPVGQDPGLAVVVHADLPLSKKVANLLWILVGRHVRVPSVLLRHLPDRELHVVHAVELEHLLRSAVPAVAAAGRVERHGVVDEAVVPVFEILEVLLADQLEASHQAVKTRVVEYQLLADPEELAELLQGTGLRGGGGRPAGHELLDRLVLHGPPLPLRELVPPVPEALPDLQGDESPHVLVEGDALNEPVILGVGRVLLDLALVVEDRLLAHVAALVELLARDVRPLAPRGGHVQQLRGLVGSGGLGVLGCHSDARVFAVLAVLASHDVRVEHHELEAPGVVEVELHLRGVADLHIDPQVLVVPYEINL